MGIDMALWRAHLDLVRAEKEQKSFTEGPLASIKPRKQDNPNNRTVKNYPSHNRFDNCSVPPFSTSCLSHKPDTETIRCMIKPILNNALNTVLLFSLALLLIMAGDVEINPGPTGMDKVLTNSDMPEVFSLLYKAQAKWFNLGLFLQIDNDTLESISHQQNSDNEVCLRQMLIHLFKSQPSTITWSDICKGLRQTTVQRVDIAKEIEAMIQSTSEEAQNNSASTEEATDQLPLTSGSTIPHSHSTTMPSQGSTSTGEHVNMFRERFVALQRQALDEVADSSLAVQDLRRTLITLPDSITQEHKQFILENYTLFRKAKTNEEIFLHLNHYHSFLDFSLFEHIIKQLGSNNLKQKMNQYAKDMREFCKETSVSSILQHLPQRSDCTCVQGHSELQAKLDINITTTTLEDLDQKRRQFASEFKLSELVLQLADIQDGSLIATWLIPMELVDHIKQHILKEGISLMAILELTVSDKVVYQSRATKEVNCLMATPNTLPDWLDKQPEGYPFDTNLLGLSPAMYGIPDVAEQELEQANNVGKGLLKSKDYTEALWIFENCLVVSKNLRGQPVNTIKYALNCAHATLKLHEITEDKQRKAKLLHMCKQYCRVCFETCQLCFGLPQRLIAKAHYRMGEALKREGDIERAVLYYTRSYNITKDVTTLSKIILLNGATRALVHDFDFKKNLNNLLKRLLTECQAEPSFKNVGNFIVHCASHDESHKKFNAAAKNLDPKVGLQLLRRFPLGEKPFHCLAEMLQDLDIGPVLSEDDEQLCYALVQTESALIMSSESLMKKLSKTSRTKHVLKCLKENKACTQISKLLKSGEINSDEIDLSRVSTEFLHSLEVMQSFLQKGVNPNGLQKSSTSPLEQLVRKYPRTPKKKERAKQAEMVQVMTALIDAGANVEDIVCYYGGHATTPLHVATELSLQTGVAEFLNVVQAKWKSEGSLKDKDDKTPLHIAAKYAHSRCSEEFIIFVWKFLINECKVDPSVKDRDKRNAASYLPPKLRDLVPVMPVASNPNSEEQVYPGKTETGPTSKHSHNETKERIAPNKQLPEENVEQKCTEQDVQEKMEELFQKPDIYFLKPEDTPKTALRDSAQRFADDKQPPEQSTPAAASRKSMASTKHIDKLPYDPESASSKWDIEISDSAKRDLEAMSTAQKKAVFDTVQELAAGEWSKSKNKKLKTHSTTVVFEAKMNKADRLLYALLDRFSEADTRKVREDTGIKKSIYVYKKKIVILDIILQHKRISHHAEQALKVLSEQDFSKENTLNLKLPQMSIHCPDKLTDAEQQEVYSCLERCDFSNAKTETVIGAKTYNLSRLTVLGLLSREHKRRDYPITLTDDEFDIVDKPEEAPVIVLGRSGTGKTTACLCRLWRKFIDYWDTEDRKDNPLLPKDRPRNEDKSAPCEEEETPLTTSEPQKLESVAAIDVESSATKDKEGKADGMEQEDESDETPSDCEHLHQVLITKSSRLCNQMKKRFCDFIADYEPAQYHEVAKEGPLPKTFSEVSDMCFPLFLTARQFFLMVDKSLDDKMEFFHENDKIISSEQPIDDIDEDDDDGGVKRIRTEVTAKYFQSHVWKKIRRKDDKIDPLLIWMEIQSFIKGSLEALTSAGGVLTKDEYEKVGRKKAPNFQFSRSKVYKMFEEYNDRTHQYTSDTFDNGDFIYNIYQRMKAEEYLQKWSLDYVYIDEVQDFTQAELAVIIQCCKDPNGFFFAGDTAQTIIRGVAFRFEDLKSIFHSLKATLPTESMLTVNHRSHHGITSLATSITDLLKYFFPNSFDWKGIPKDSSQYDGPKPLFLCRRSLADLFVMLQSKSQSSSIIFGADQAVIIRDEESREKLPPSLQGGIVLTVQQCKGLEFNDVLLYNFFTDFNKDSTTKQQQMWKVSASYLERHSEVVVNKPYGKPIHSPPFNESYHKSLCSELKYLYTVVTRARHHLWIYESLLPDDLPMLEYWHQRDVIKVVEESSDSVKDFHDQFPSSESTPDDWRRRGDEMRELKLWKMAIKCYQHAGEPVLEKEAYIELLKEEATEVKDTDQKLYAAKYRLVATTYLECDGIQHDVQQLQHAAHALSNAGMYGLSATVFEKLQKYNSAFKIYDSKLKQVEDAARMKESLGEYTEAISYCCKRNRSDMGVQLVKRFEKDGHVHQSQITTIACEQTTRCLKGPNKNIKDLKEWLHFIPHQEQKLHIKKQAQLYQEVFDTLKSNQRHDEAFRLASAQGMFADGISLATECKNQEMVRELKLQQATEEIAKTGTIQSADILEFLTELNHRADSQPSIVAKAKLLLAMQAVGLNTVDGNVSTTDEVLRLCTEALKIHNKSNKVGAIECFHQLKQFQTTDTKRLLSSIQQTLHMIQDVEVLAKHIKDTNYMLQLESYYGFEKSATGNVYFIPRHQDLWIQRLEKCSCEGEPFDSDGMLKLDQEKVLTAVKRHISGYATEWKEGLKGPSVSTTIQEEFKFRFPFHKEMQEHKYLEPRKRTSATDQLKAYITHCETAAAIYTLNTQSFSHGNPIDAFILMLSPFAQVLVHFTEEHYRIIAQSTKVKQALLNRAENTLQRFDNTCDQWLETWRIFGMLGQGKHLSKKHKTAVKSQLESQSDTISEDYEWDYTTKEYVHYFSDWFTTCEHLKKGKKVLLGIQISTDYFIRLALARGHLHISVENLVSILSVHTTALLAVLAHSYSTQTQTVIPVPETFQRFVRTFDLINCIGGKADIGLQVACYKTAKDMNPKTIKSKVQKQLTEFLKLLLGKHESNYKPLEISLCDTFHLRSGSALHCLLLTLTVYGNLALMTGSAQASFLLEALGDIQHCLDKPNIPYKNVQKKLLDSTTTAHVFQIISMLLTEKLEMSVMTMKATSKDKIEFKPCLLHNIPKIHLPQQPLSHVQQALAQETGYSVPPCPQQHGGPSMVNQPPHWQNRGQVTTNQPPLQPVPMVSQSAPMASPPKTSQPPLQQVRPPMVNQSAPMASQPPLQQVRPPMVRQSAPMASPPMTSQPPPQQVRPPMASQSAPMTSQPPLQQVRPPMANQSAPMASQPPLQQVRPPMASQSAPMTSQPPLQQVRPPMANQFAPMANQPPLQQVRPPMANQSAPMTSQPPLQQVRPPMANQFAPMANQPPLQQVRPPMVNQFAPMTNQPPLQQVRPPMANQFAPMANQPPLQQVRPPMVNQSAPMASPPKTSQPPLQQVRPPMANQFAPMANQPPLQQVRPPMVNQSASMASQPPLQQVRPPMVNQSASMASQPPLQQVRPPMVNQSTPMASPSMTSQPPLQQVRPPMANQFAPMASPSMTSQPPLQQVRPPMASQSAPMTSQPPLQQLRPPMANQSAPMASPSMVNQPPLQQVRPPMANLPPLQPVPMINQSALEDIYLEPTAVNQPPPNQVYIDEDEDYDLAQERKAMREEQSEDSDESDIENQEAVGFLGDVPRMCIICIHMFANQLQFEQHQQTENHIVRVKWYENYQKAILSDNFNNLIKSASEYEKMGFGINYVHPIAILEANMILRTFSVINFHTQRTGDWSRGLYEIQRLSERLPTAIVKLELQMNKLRKAHQTQALPFSM